MTLYTVSWVIDIHAEGPYSAAEQALWVQRDPDSSATVFQVIEHGNPEAELVTIDFDPF